MILDTTAVIDILRGEPVLVKHVETLENKGISFSTTAISVFEVWQGIKEGVSEDKKERIESLFNSLRILPFELESAKEAGNIQSSLKHEGNEIDPEDSMIAGIARKANETIITRNVKHFSRIRNLKIESY